MFEDIQITQPGVMPEAVYESSQPVVLRGLVTHWELVKQSSISVTAANNYLKRFSINDYAGVNVGEPDIEGKFGYTEDGCRLNFQKFEAPFNDVLDRLESNFAIENAPAVYMGSAPISHHLPRLLDANPIDLNLPETAKKWVSKIWLSSKTKAACHYDMSHNVACCVAGIKQFLLFPPEQIKNLYPGPMDLTPAGPVISLVDFSAPDFEKFPRARSALENAYTLTLHPGDALYLPAFWWHDVRSECDYNMLVNFWWSKMSGDIAASVKSPLLHAMAAIRKLDRADKEAVRTLFDFYVFNHTQSYQDNIAKEALGYLDSESNEQSAELYDIVKRMLERR